MWDDLLPAGLTSISGSFLAPCQWPSASMVLWRNGHGVRSGVLSDGTSQLWHCFGFRRAFQPGWLPSALAVWALRRENGAFRFSEWVLGWVETLPNGRSVRCRRGCTTHLGTSRTAPSTSSSHGLMKQGWSSFRVKEPSFRESKRGGQGHRSDLPPGRGGIFMEPSQPLGHTEPPAGLH